MTPKLSQAERIARKLDPPPALPSTPSAELLRRIAPRPTVPKSPPYIEPMCIEEQLAAGVTIEAIATAKVSQWRAGDPAAWVTAVEAVAAVIAAEPPAEPAYHGLPELAPPPARKSKLQPIENLILERVPYSQACGIVVRHHNLAAWDAPLAAAAIMAVAHALDIGSCGAAATLAADADDRRRAQLGLRDGEPLCDSFAGRVGPRPLDTLNAILAGEKTQRAEREARREEQQGGAW